MKIERPDTPAVQRAQPVQRAESARAAQSAKPVAGAGGPDRVEFSPQALELARARAALASVPEVRADLVADLRQQVQAGEYRPPVEKLARRLSALV